MVFESTELGEVQVRAGEEESGLDQSHWAQQCFNTKQRDWKGG